MNNFCQSYCLFILNFVIQVFIRSSNAFQHTSFIILSQPNDFHSKLSQETRERLRETLNDNGFQSTQILIASEDISYHGSWTIFPILPELIIKLKLTEIKWFVFLGTNSRINIEVLHSVLKDHKNEHFIGYELEDSSHTVIHHYSDPKYLQYPDFDAGFILSGSLVKDLAMSIAEFGHQLDWIPSDFSIDPQYEFAKALKMRNSDLKITHDARLCIQKKDDCAIYIKDNKNLCNATDDTVLKIAAQTFFAIKTCSKFHDERLPIIKKTWAKSAQNIMYFSEVTDAEIGTVQLDGVTNTERGHCHKTMEIISYFNKHAPKHNWKWLVIADDDTILSVHKLLEFLHCFDPKKSIHLGQRYGYNVASGLYGYDYVTGGGGMIFSLEMTRTIMKNLPICSCASKDSPDDMHLGICLSNLGIDIVHSPRFHQARPEDYAKDLLIHQDPISFHKFWNTDPLKIYDKWFRKADQKLEQYKYNLDNPHQEL